MKTLFSLTIIFGLVLIYLVLSHTDLLQLSQNQNLLISKITELGALGPLLVIALMSTAIVLSPIPSAPIALAAGAAYGHTFGTIYIITGAQLGAVIAFLIARYTSSEAVNKLISKDVSERLKGAQNTLMATVFISRILPFISFDVISYAAGVSPIKFWRFFVATLVGLLPTSFALAHFGSELASTELNKISYSILALGLLFSLPAIIKKLGGS